MPNIAILFFPLLMAFAASSDLLTMRISNKLVLLLAAGFVGIALLVEMPLQQFAMHVLCAAIVLVVAFVMFALRWIGGGDAKLAAATALWLGFANSSGQPSLMTYLAYTAIFGGLLTLAILMLRRIPLDGVFYGRPWLNWLNRLHDPKQGVPYGVAMALAGILVYSNTSIFGYLSA
ncbi:prepilin peptidase CpaA [Devosia lucknowensis]|uniref:Prepilin peptidase CpaA n=1 Tax=Devosia lucknowensis TaxID=1096929 RepID=A0A1Y6E6L6_9HYPH|nr:prepilin peptidase [Devosia lucknowensis]SMQ58357.1 prepilin peptidase CpaA [Devosia lucknowensis]